MTVTTAYSALTFNCNGSATAFSITWPFFLSSDLVVTHVTSAGVETALVLTTDYTVTGGRDSTTGLPAVGTLTTVATYAAGVTLRVERATPRTQSTSFTTSGAFPAKTVEAAFDRVHMIAEEGTGGGQDGVTGDVMRLETSGATDYWDAAGYTIRDAAPGADTGDVATYGQLSDIVLQSGNWLGTTGATDNRLLRADGTGGATLQASPIGVTDDGDVSGIRDVSPSGVVTARNTGLHILDTDESHDLIVKPGSNLTADRTLTVTTGDVDRTLDISAANVTVSAFAATLLDDTSARSARFTLSSGRYLELEDYGGSGDGSSDNTAALNAAVAAMADLDVYTIRLRGGGSIYQFNSKPNSFSVPVILVGESYSTTVLRRGYSEAGGNNVGFMTWSGSGATGGGLFDCQVLAAAGTTGGTMVVMTTGVDDVAGFQRMADCVVTYTGDGSYYRCLLIDGSLNAVSGSQGLRDFTARNVYLFKPSTGTESARMLNATNMDFDGWANGTIVVFGGGSTLTNTTNARLNVTCLGQVFVGNSKYVYVAGTVDTIIFSTGTTQCKFSGVVQITSGGTSDSGTDNQFDAYQDWQTYTPTVSASSGTITTAAATGRYKVDGNLVHVQINITITTNGTGAGGLIATLPIAVPNISGISRTLIGREQTSTGHIVQGYITPNSSSVAIYFYDNSYPGASGRTINVNGVYEIA